ncbi:phosphotransferase family protein [Nitratidesulfovibrio sp. 1201_IL3209]|uniref:phosphotransferase family protein n=1 Tax=Nitratidesulfovibrio sp. 1201_IL3209 TaxID=3084053 RepID=UPI002FDA83F0
MLDLPYRFGITPRRLATEFPLPGSPERCLTRTAVQGDDGRLWMLERLAPAQVARREAMGDLLAQLADPAVSGPDLARLVPAYLPVDDASPRNAPPDATPADAAPKGSALRHVLAADTPPHAGYWQLSPFVPGAEPPRPDYLDHAWRGRAVAALLLALHRAGDNLPAGLPPAPVPPLPAFIAGLHEAVARRMPEAARRLHPVRDALEALPDVLAAQPVVLAHGDAHPLNLIWTPREDGDDTPPPPATGPLPAGPLAALRGVIDWEFAGAQPVLYDAANCIGCVGFEHPSGLGRAFAAGFTATLREGAEQYDLAGIPADTLRHLPLMVLASRFGWLSEWLRRSDRDMLDMELDYCDILLHHRHQLMEMWAGG